MSLSKRTSKEQPKTSPIREPSKPILVLGAGTIGGALVDFLSGIGHYRVTVADSSDICLARINTSSLVSTQKIDVLNQDELVSLMREHFAVLCAMPFHVTRHVADAAAIANIHYLDLTEDVETTQRVKELAKTSRSAFIPQCGLAPGFITIAAHHLATKFDELDDLHMRVGALPQFPSNALKYNITWSTEGLINEYCMPCEAIVDGKYMHVPPLEELERFSLDGMDYEAFNTSGGLGTLCESLAGKVKNLNYRTVRYPGHRDIMKTLLHDLKLKDRQDLLKDILENALACTKQDVVLVFVNAKGRKDGALIQESYVNKVYSQEILGKHFSAIQITTAAGVCTVLDLLVENKIPNVGLVKQEDISFTDFIQNRFGRFYASATRVAA